MCRSQYSGLLPAASRALSPGQSLPCQNEPSQNRTSLPSTMKSGEPCSLGWDLYRIPPPLMSRAASRSGQVPLLLIFDITSDRFSLVNTSNAGHPGGAD